MSETVGEDTFGDVPGLAGALLFSQIIKKRLVLRARSRRLLPAIHQPALLSSAAGLPTSGVIDARPCCSA
jgi:hypothetical protein